MQFGARLPVAPRIAYPQLAFTLTGYFLKYPAAFQRGCLLHRMKRFQTPCGVLESFFRETFPNSLRSVGKFFLRACPDLFIGNLETSRFGVVGKFFDLDFPTSCRDLETSLFGSLKRIKYFQPFNSFKIFLIMGNNG